MLRLRHVISFLAIFAGSAFSAPADSVAAQFADSSASPSADTVAYKGYFQIGTDFNFGLNGGPTDPTFAVDTVETYGQNWRGLRIPLETARSYEDHVDPFFMLSFRAGYKDFHFLIEAPLRKDIEAWYDSDLKTNFTYKPSELDIAVPINAYAKWDNDVGYVQLGRFSPDDLKVSPNDLALGGTPYHDGLLWKFEPGIFRYDFLVSSLNAWLFGDVVEDADGAVEALIDEDGLQGRGLAADVEGVEEDVGLEAAGLEIQVADFFGHLRHDKLVGQQPQFLARLLPHRRVGDLEHGDVEQQGVIDAVVLDEGGVDAGGAGIAGVVLAHLVRVEEPVGALPQREDSQLDEQADAHPKPETSYVPRTNHICFTNRSIVSQVRSLLRPQVSILV